MDEEQKKFMGKALKKASELLENEPSEQALIKEYEVCQSYVNALDNQFWISMTIIFSINIAALAGIGYAIINIGGHLPSNTTYLILLIGLGLILISNLLKFWQKRVRFLTRINNDRMFEIEEILGIEKTRRIRGIDAYYREQPEKNIYFSNLDEDTRMITNKAIDRSNIIAPFWWPLKKGFWYISFQIIKSIFWFLLTFILDLWSDGIKPIVKRPTNMEYKPDTVNIVITILMSVIPILWIILIVLSYTKFN